MKKFRFIVPLLAFFIAASIAWKTQPNRTLSDYVWFEVDANGNPKDAFTGIRGDQSPFDCPDNGAVPCARALSISQSEVSLNSGSTTLYHINSGVDMQNDYDQEETKQ